MKEVEERTTTGCCTGVWFVFKQAHAAKTYRYSDIIPRDGASQTTERDQKVGLGIKLVHSPLPMETQQLLLQLFCWPYDKICMAS